MTEAEWLACVDPNLMLEALGAGGLASDRKLRLFACACCRRVWDEQVDGRVRAAVGAAEAFADGLIDPATLEAARKAAGAAGAETRNEAVRRLRKLSAELYPEMDQDDPDLAYGDQDCGAEAGSAASAAERACGPDLARLEYYDIHHAASDAVRYLKRRLAPYEELEPKKPPSEVNGRLADECRVQAELLRCVFGNPFRPGSVDPSWLARGGALARLAWAAYDDLLLPEGNLDPARLAVLSDALEEAGCADADLLAHLRSASPHVRGCWAVDLILGKG
jgi:hypothetical protein